MFSPSIHFTVKIVKYLLKLLSDLRYLDALRSDFQGYGGHFWMSKLHPKTLLAIRPWCDLCVIFPVSGWVYIPALETVQRESRERCPREFPRTETSVIWISALTFRPHGHSSRKMTRGILKRLMFSRFYHPSYHTHTGSTSIGPCLNQTRHALTVPDHYTVIISVSFFLSSLIL